MQPGAELRKMNWSRQCILSTQLDCGGGSVSIGCSNDDDAMRQSFDRLRTGSQQMAQGCFGDIVQRQENCIRWRVDGGVLALQQLKPCPRQCALEAGRTSRRVADEEHRGPDRAQRFLNHVVPRKKCISLVSQTFWVPMFPRRVVFKWHRSEAR
jgi:aspartate oxidase